MPAPSVSRREFGLSLAALPALASAASLTEKPPQVDDKQKKAAQASKDEDAKPASNRTNVRKFPKPPCCSA